MKEHLTYTLGHRFRLEQGPELRFRLRTNSALDQLAERLRSTKPNWERLHNVISTGRHREHGNGDFVGHLGEQHVQMVLDDIKNTSTQDIVLNPIKSGTKTKNFSFYEGGNGNLVVKNKKTQEDVTDYDSLMLVDGLPVVGSVRLSGRREKRGHLGVFDNDFINKTLQPLHEHFGTNTFGFLAIVPPEMVEGKASELRLFKNGGIIVPVAATLDQFRKQAEQLQTNGDRLKQEKELERQLRKIPSSQDIYLSEQRRKQRRNDRRQAGR